ncbi:WD_REPEATS_REGION domain-containing protein [Mortierella sp. GBA39]|nr:WD_REPEATS_REGION domain-containing protein [Mortierella sp. GBA39]
MIKRAVFSVVHFLPHRHSQTHINTNNNNSPSESAGNPSAVHLFSVSEVCSYETKSSPYQPNATALICYNAVPAPASLFNSNPAQVSTMSSSSPPGGYSPPPPIPPDSASSDTGKKVTQIKRLFSLVENLFKTGRTKIFSTFGYPRVEFAIPSLRIQLLGEYKQPVYIPPIAKPRLQAPDDTLLPLMDKVKDFLAGDAQVMLILGDSGAGKSTFIRHLEHELWQEYKEGGRIPLFINLPALERPEKDLVAEQLRTHNFLEDQIRKLKKHRRFILICDGYDESQLTSNLHTTNLLNRPGQWDVKLLITCRTQYLGPDYRGRFVPNAAGMYNRAADDLFMEAVITPFSKEQIEDYVKYYVPLELRTWVKKDYMDKLKTIPYLMDLVKNPFLLTLCLEALPDAVKGKSDLSRLRVTRVQLYDNFTQHWLGVNKRRLEEHRLREGRLLAFEWLLEDGFESNGIKFQQNLAAAIFREQGGRPIVVYTPRRDRDSWKAMFFGPAHDISLLRDASLLSRVGTQYRFVHRSLLEYFYSCSICGPNDSSDEFAPHPLSNSSDIRNHPLSQRNLMPEPSIIQFLAERVQLDPGFKQQLLIFIEQSKADVHAACAAANAITILVKAGVSFNEADLRAIRIPGADLSGGHFGSAQLQEADLTGVDLTKSCIRLADLSEARMEGVQFGELPLLKEVSAVKSAAYSPDRKSLAVGLRNGIINIYDTATWTRRTRRLLGHRKEVSALAYSSSGQKLLSGSDDCTVRLWTSQAGSIDFTMHGHLGSVEAVAFSPLSAQVASASGDMTVRLWDSRTGASLFVLKAHASRVVSIAYSPDGRHAVSGSTDGTIRRWDTRSGLQDSVMGDRFESVYCVAHSPDGLWVVAGDHRGMLQLWESETRKSAKYWKGHPSEVYAVNFSPNGQWIASSGQDCTVKLWDAHTGAFVSAFAGHSAPAQCVVFSPNGIQLASGSTDETTRLWDLTITGPGLDLGDDQSHPIRNVTYSPCGRSLIATNKSGMLRQYDAMTGEPGLMLRCGSFQINCVAISPDGRRIASAGYSDFIKIWSVETGVAELTLRGHTNNIGSVIFSPNGRWIASGSWDNTVRLWCARSGTPGLVLSGHNNGIITLAFSPCGLQVVSGSEDGTVRVWEVGTGESRVAVDVGLRIPAVAVTHMPSGLHVVLRRFTTEDVELWSEESVEAAHSLKNGLGVDIVTFSSCGQWIATGVGTSVWLWSMHLGDSVQEWICVQVIRGFPEGIESIAWRPGALEFVTGTRAGSVQTWELVEESNGRFSARSVWSSGYSVFVATGAVVVGAVGLSAMNQKLLKQRGAKDGSSSS